MSRVVLGNSILLAMGLSALAGQANGQACSSVSGWGIQGKDCPVGTDAATDANIKDRCWRDGEAIDPADPKKDHLYSHQAQPRVDWAVGCGYVGTDPRTLRLFREVFDAFDNVWVPRQRPGFPTYAYKDQDFTVWKPERQTTGYPALPGSCQKPANVHWVTICEAGCYERSMQLLFSDGYKTIEQAIEDEQSGAPQFLMTLNTDSTLENLSYTKTPVSAFTRDAAEAEEWVLKFETASGGTIKVTDNHPLVTDKGSIQPASVLNIGDKLVKDSGEFDEIVSIEKKLIRGKVYNIAPATYNPLTNIVVAEGFLNGSQKYQDQQIQDLNRLAIRSSLPAELL